MAGLSASAILETEGVLEDTPMLAVLYNLLTVRLLPMLGHLELETIQGQISVPSGGKQIQILRIPRTMDGWRPL